jgi:hypothetical protein
MAHSIEILSDPLQFNDRTWRLVAATVDNSGQRRNGRALTAAIFKLEDETWWNATTNAWQAIRVENDMTETALVGLHTLVLDGTELSPTGAELNLVVEVTIDDPAGHSHIHCVHLRNSLGSFPIEDEAAPSAITTVAQLFNALAAVVANNMFIDDSAKQLIIYQSDGETAALTFDLKDAAGLPSTLEPFIRTRA